ncbi:ribosomal protein S18 acetylase RimI-like enzyme [Friedmanniella endophytica]|uniref:Ribosomal protein S18 acetylase RimI-like enzyme n=1 Tax=Microlunatus kandeliicorticis TaxID=1759536 RepID=A0A7W3IQ49_9ACTN|nr:GNAT family N-acetyltransferase [Microlunatus kandeliicorticis]MBA8793165.1 ribosomal protein S18 acetylase RimI-like enzyme [Microlunatus kandeliicorticis]
MSSGDTPAGGDRTAGLGSVAFARLARGNARRWARLDPLLPVPRELLDGPADAPVEPAVGDRPDTDPGRLLAARSGDSAAAGRWRHVRLDPTSLPANYDWLESHRLRAAVDGTDQAAALTALLDRWVPEVAALADPVAQPDTGLTVTWPARDVQAVAALTRRGFAPVAVVAARLRAPRRADGVGSGVPTATIGPADPDDGLELRPARLDDLDAVVALQLEELFYDDLLGGLHLRSSVERAVRAAAAAALSRNDGSRILALRDGSAVGLVAVDLPDQADVGGLAAADRVGYVDCLSVTAGARGSGVGRRLARAADDRLAEDGAAVVLLTHSTVNPLSAPFWAREGFRPLWVIWSRPLLLPA